MGIFSVPVSTFVPSQTRRTENHQMVASSGKFRLERNDITVRRGAPCHAAASDLLFPQHCYLLSRRTEQILDRRNILQFIGQAPLVCTRKARQSVSAVASLPHERRPDSADDGAPAECIGPYEASAALWASLDVKRQLQAAPKANQKLLLTRGAWTRKAHSPADGEAATVTLRGRLELHNLTRREEICVPEVSAEIQLLSCTDTASIAVTTRVSPRHQDGTGYPPEELQPRSDGYWTVYSVKPRSFTVVEVEFILSGPADALEALQSAVVSVNFGSYGFQGLTTEHQRFVLPLSIPEMNKQGKNVENRQWILQANGARVLPISTHLLSHLDDPVSVVRRYAMGLARPGDVVAIAESALAVMQSRYRHPSSIFPGHVARLLCRLFSPISSLSTACGMQALIDIIGRLRAIVAAAGAILLRLLGRRGGFYRLAGPQARLVDDLTGTLPPYDQFVVLGPYNAQGAADAVERRTGIAAAIVDVNDLSAKSGDALVLAASGSVDHAFVAETLVSNPQGNANQQTPIVLIRPATTTVSPAA